VIKKAEIPLLRREIGSLKLIPIKGRVIDEQGQSVPGATVMIKGRSEGVKADGDGLFDLDVEAGATLVISSIGYKTQELKFEGNPDIVVILEGLSQVLDELVVVGYGAQRKSSVVGAVDQVNASAFEGRPSASTTQALQGVSPSL